MKKFCLYMFYLFMRYWRLSEVLYPPGSLRLKLRTASDLCFRWIWVGLCFKNENGLTMNQHRHVNIGITMDVDVNFNVEFDVCFVMSSLATCPVNSMSTSILHATSKINIEVAKPDNTRICRACLQPFPSRPGPPQTGVSSNSILNNT